MLMRSKVFRPLELVEKLPQSSRARELSLQQALGTAVIALKGYTAPEAERAHTRALQLCEELGDLVQLFFALNGLWSVYLLGGEQGRAYELGEQMLRRAESGHDPALSVLAYGALGLTSVEMGQYPAAREHL